MQVTATTSSQNIELFIVCIDDKPKISESTNSNTIINANPVDVKPADRYLPYSSTLRLQNECERLQTSDPVLAPSVDLTDSPSTCSTLIPSKSPSIPPTTRSI